MSYRPLRWIKCEWGRVYKSVTSWKQSLESGDSPSLVTYVASFFNHCDKRTQICLVPPSPFSSSTIEATTHHSSYLDPTIAHPAMTSPPTPSSDRHDLALAAHAPHTSPPVADPAAKLANLELDKAEVEPELLPSANTTAPNAAMPLPSTSPPRRVATPTLPPRLRAALRASTTASQRGPRMGLVPRASKTNSLRAVVKGPRPEPPARSRTPRPSLPTLSSDKEDAFGEFVRLTSFSHSAQTRAAAAAAAASTSRETTPRPSTCQESISRPSPRHRSPGSSPTSQSPAQERGRSSRRESQGQEMSENSRIQVCQQSEFCFSETNLVFVPPAIQCCALSLINPRRRLLGESC